MSKSLLALVAVVALCGVGLPGMVSAAERDLDGLRLHARLGQLLLEELDLVRERGLGHRDRSRRPGEMPVGRDGDGVTQLAEFHIDSRSKPV